VQENQVKSPLFNEGAIMTEVLFYLSVGFFGYAAYVLVDEQRRAKPSVKPKPVVTAIKPASTKKPSKAATAKKAKPASAKKPPALAIKKPAGQASDAILAYLSKNGVTTVAKLTRELPESRKVIESRIERLIQEGSIAQTTIGRAKAVAVKG
jgi:predicted HTH transcriptional regulator